MSSEKTPEINQSDFPALYRAADELSISAQKKYLWLVRIDLLVLVVAATLTALRISSVFGAERILRTMSVLLLLFGIVLTLILSRKKYRREWYGARAIAESIKTLSWRFMMRSDPFDAKEEQKGVERAFLESLREIRKESEMLSIVLDRQENGRPITERMLNVRNMDISGRRQVYMRGRIRDQQSWYGKKSSENKKKQSWLFRSVILAQLLAVGAAVSAVATPGLLVNLTGVLSTAAAALLAWLQVKRHEELAQSYATAAHELGLVAEQSRHVSEEDEFSAFVADAENAISREHTLWIARRDHLPNLKPYI